MENEKLNNGATTPNNESKNDSNGAQPSTQPVLKKVNWLPRILILIVVIMFLYGVLAVTTILFYDEVFGWIYNLIAALTSDGYMAMSLSALLVALLFQLPLGKIFRSWLPLVPQKGKAFFRSITFVILAAIFIFSHFAQRNVFFDKDTGMPKKYYSIHPDGTYHFYTSPGYDSETGDRLRLVDKNIIAEGKRQNLISDGTDSFISIVIVIVTGIIIFAFVANRGPRPSKPVKIEPVSQPTQQKIPLYQPAVHSGSVGTVENKCEEKIKIFIFNQRECIYNPLIEGSSYLPLNLNPGSYSFVIVDGHRNLLGKKSTVVAGLDKQYVCSHIFGPRGFTGIDKKLILTLDFKSYEKYYYYVMCIQERGWKLIIEPTKFTFKAW